VKAQVVSVFSSIYTASRKEEARFSQGQGCSSEKG